MKYSDAEAKRTRKLITIFEPAHKSAGKSLTICEGYEHRMPRLHLLAMPTTN